MFAFFPAKGIQAICHPSPHGLCGILMLRKRLAVAATWMGKSITCALCVLRNLEPHVLPSLTFYRRSAAASGSNLCALGAAVTCL